LGRANAFVELLFPIIWVGRVDIVQVVGVGMSPTSFDAYNEGPAVLFGISDGLDSKSQGYGRLQVAVGARAIFGVQVSQVDSGVVQAMGIKVEHGQTCKGVRGEYLVAGIGAKVVKVELHHRGILQHVRLEIQISVSVMRGSVVHQHLALTRIIAADAQVRQLVAHAEVSREIVAVVQGCRRMQLIQCRGTMGQVTHVSAHTQAYSHFLTPGKPFLGIQRQGMKNHQPQ